MEQLIFDSGVKEYQLPGGILRFNPSDPNVYARFMDATEQIRVVEQEMAAQANSLPEGNAQNQGEATLRIMRETDRRMKEILNGIFGHGNDFDVLLEHVNLMAVATNGARVISNLLDALQPIMEAGAKACVDQEINSAKLNREQRRAMKQ